MDDRFREIAALAATQHSIVSTAQLLAYQITPSLRSKWERAGLIDRVGPRSFAMAGSTPTWERAIAVGLADLGGFGVVAGRAGRACTALMDFLPTRPSSSYIVIIAGTRPTDWSVLLVERSPEQTS